MSRILFTLIAMLFSFSAAASLTAKPIIILVPGFFNSLAPGNQYGPYFSRAIVETLQKRAEVLIVNNLAPVGGVNENAHRLLDFLNEVQKTHPGQAFHLITHSAGGLYAMQALTWDSNQPVKTVVTLSAPYEGIDFIENLAANVPGIESLAQFLNFGSLKEFRKQQTDVLMKSLKMPSHIRWVALSGNQKPCFLVTCALSQRLSWVLTISQKLMKGISDGIVTVDSALATHLSIPVERWSDLPIPLEHWEMVEEARLFHLIGVADTGYIESTQRHIYSQILERIL
jgi:hypothetical protein